MILAILTICFIFSCSSDDDSNEEFEIKGVWILSSEPNAYNYYPQCNIDKEKMTVTHANKTERTSYDGNDCNTVNTVKFFSYFADTYVELIEFGGGNNPDKNYVERYNVISRTNSKMVIELYYIDFGFTQGNGQTVPITIPENKRVQEIWKKI